MPVIVSAWEYMVRPWWLSTTGWCTPSFLQSNSIQFLLLTTLSYGRQKRQIIFFDGEIGRMGSNLSAVYNRKGHRACMEITMIPSSCRKDRGGGGAWVRSQNVPDAIICRVKVRCHSRWMNTRQYWPRAIRVNVVQRLQETEHRTSRTTNRHKLKKVFPSPFQRLRGNSLEYNGSKRHNIIRSEVDARGFDASQTKP